MKKLFTLLTCVLTSVLALKAQVARKVLIEEFTGTWCVNCPDGHTILKGIEAANPNKVLVVGLHNGDAFTIPYETSLESAFAVAAFPRAAIDRVVYSGGNANVMSRSYWAGAVAARLNITSPVEIIINPSLNGNTLTTKVDYTFKADINEETRLTCVLLEDSIIAAQTGGTTNYVHMDVCRATFTTDFWGDANNPTSVTNGQAFTKTYTYTVPATLNKNNLRVVAFINKKIGASPVYGSGTEILNAEVAKVYNFATATNNVEANIINANCYPNPFTNITALDFNITKDANVNAFVTDLSGKVIKNIISEKRSAGKHTIYWGGDANTTLNLNNGLYFINVLTEDSKICKPVVLNR